MKVLSLNIWGGDLEKELLEFFEKHKDIDVICLQEVYDKAKEKITDESRYLSLNILFKIHEVLDDYNLLSESESLQILDEGMHNCIASYNITSTRTSYYSKEIRFADYMFLSKNLKVDSFKVLPDEVSNHAPLYLDFSLDRAFHL